jgi:hypothetical protein
MFAHKKKLVGPYGLVSYHLLSGEVLLVVGLFYFKEYDIIHMIAKKEVYHYTPLNDSLCLLFTSKFPYALIQAVWHWEIRTDNVLRFSQLNFLV